jgi:16S rRNA (guanine966-N2)-methyltransferase
MRIIAGKYKGRTIAAPDTMDTRPILDRVKVVLFDMLGHRLAQPGWLPPMPVLDLFAGSGALGLEALSRGARYCLFVEQSRSIAAVIRQNLDTLEIVREADVVQADAGRYAFKPPPPVMVSAEPPDEIPLSSDLAPSSPGGPQGYGLVFVDPPYRMLSGPRPNPNLRDVFGRLAYDPGIAANALIVVRHAAQGGTDPDLSPLVEHERREVGKMILRFMVRPGSEW